MDKRFYIAVISLAGLFILSFFRTSLQLEVYEILVIILTLFCLVIFPIKYYINFFNNPLSREGFVGFGLFIGTINSIVNLISNTGAIYTIIQLSLIVIAYYLYNKYISSRGSELIGKLEIMHNSSFLENKSLSSYDFIRWLLILYFLITAFIFNNIYAGNYSIIVSLLILILFSSNLKIFYYSITLPFSKCKRSLEKLNANYTNNLLLEKISQCQDIFIDIRGVVLEDKYKLETIHASNPNYALQIAASLMHGDSHPLSKAVALEADSKNLTRHLMSHTNRFQGKGIIGRINHENFAIGNMELMKEVDIAVGVLIREKIKLENQGKTVLVLAKTVAEKKHYDKNPGEVIGLFIFNNEVISQFDKINQEFRNENIRLTYLSGEEKSTLLTRLKNVMHEELIANLSSGEKTKFIEQTLQKNIDKYYIQISKKLVIDESNLVNILIDNYKIISPNILSISGYDPEKLSNIYKSIIENYKKANINYRFSWLYHIFAMLFSILAVSMTNSSYIYIIAFMLSLSSEQLIIVNSKTKK